MAEARVGPRPVGSVNASVYGSDVMSTLERLRSTVRHVEEKEDEVRGKYERAVPILQAHCVLCYLGRGRACQY